MKHSIVNSQNISKNCMVCGVDNEFGLKTRFYETDRGELVAVFNTIDQHQSYPKITHGGITAAILDEVIGRAIMITDPQTFGVTIELTVRYKKTVPTKTELKAVGRITQDRGRIFSGSGELYLPNGEVAVEAEGRFMKRRLDQITDQDFSVNEWFEPGDELPSEISL